LEIINFLKTVSDQHATSQYFRFPKLVSQVSAHHYESLNPMQLNYFTSLMLISDNVPSAEHYLLFPIQVENDLDNEVSMNAAEYSCCHEYGDLASQKYMTSSVKIYNIVVMMDGTALLSNSALC
jgi:hypothetical protein